MTTSWSLGKPPSISNAFLICCILPIFILALTNIIVDKNETVARVILGAGAGGNDGRSGKALYPKTRGNDDGNVGERVDLKASINRAKIERDQQNESRQKGSRSSSSSSSSTSQKEKKRTEEQHARRGSGSSQNQIVDDNIERIRSEYRNDPNDIYKTLALADALRKRDLVHHDGGSIQKEAISMYQSAIQLILTKRRDHHLSSDDSTITTTANAHLEDGRSGDLNDQLFLDNNAKSIDGLLLFAYCCLGKQFFMANMFEKSVEAYDKAIEIEPDYMDALASRSGALIVLGKYMDAGSGYDRLLELDHKDVFTSVYPNVARVLMAEKDALPGGWDRLTKPLERIIPELEATLKTLEESSPLQANTKSITDTLQSLHLAYFSYYDHQTQNTSSAWRHLSLGHKYKLSSLPPYHYDQEKRSIESVKQIFIKTFFPDNVGSQDAAPIFIIGFPRSGSTLLERVLDSHPLIVGTGEDSVFNGKLSSIRDAIVDASMSGSLQILQNALQEKADDVVRTTKERWEEIDRNTDAEDSDTNKTNEYPKRFADKMLSNYLNVGFIQMLFPNALILHTSRDPMDTLFSAFKHDFPAGSLDHTSDFKSLNQMYRGYRDIIDHWDTVLPGRVTHVRYEDMVNDMPGVAKAIISATGLPWNPDVLNFHKKKHAVNTYSTTQVRKAVYRDSMQSWRKYEAQLQPLLQLIGPYAEHSTKTTLEGYIPPS